MTSFFDAATGGFFDDSLHKDIPPTAIPLTDEAYLALLAAQGDGKLLTVVDGAVKAVLAPPPAPETQLEIIRRRRNRLLAATDKILSVPDFPISQDRRAALFHWRAALRDLPASLDAAAPFDSLAWPTRPDWLDECGEITAAETN